MFAFRCSVTYAGRDSTPIKPEWTRVFGGSFRFVGPGFGTHSRRLGEGLGTSGWRTPRGGRRSIGSAALDCVPAP